MTQGLSGKGWPVFSFDWQVSFPPEPADPGDVCEPSDSEDTALPMQTGRPQFESPLCHLEVIGAVHAPIFFSVKWI